MHNYNCFDCCEDLAYLSPQDCVCSGFLEKKFVSALIMYGIEAAETRAQKINKIRWTLDLG